VPGPNGERVIVVRPSDPELACKLADEAHRSRDRDRIARLPSELEGRGVVFTFVGYLGSGAITTDRQRPDSPTGAPSQPAGNPCVVDLECNILGPLVNGDSMVIWKSTSGPVPAMGSVIRMRSSEKGSSEASKDSPK
jgi:hypothetical protein